MPRSAAYYVAFDRKNAAGTEYHEAVVEYRSHKYGSIAANVAWRRVERAMDELKTAEKAFTEAHTVERRREIHEGRGRNKTHGLAVESARRSRSAKHQPRRKDGRFA